MALIQNDRLFADRAGRLYEIVKVFPHSAVTTSYPPEEKGYCVLSVPEITDGLLRYRTKNYVAKLGDAIATAKEISMIYQDTVDLKTINKTAKDIDIAVSQSYRGNYRYDIDSAYDELIKSHSAYDISLASALTVKHYDWDGRISANNKMWAENFLKSFEVDTEKYERFAPCKTHLAIFNSFTDVVKVRQAQRSLAKAIDPEDKDRTGEQGDSKKR